jgi:FdhD protein
MTKFALTPSEIIKVSNSDVKHVNDLLSVEEPLEIILVHFLDGNWVEKNIAVTMRTPGNDIDLTIGFLFTEGIIQSYDQIKRIEESVSIESNNGLISNQIKFHLKENIQFDMLKLERNFYTTSSCGVCGKASIDAVKIACPIIVPSEKWKIKKELLLTLNDSLRDAQENFNFSGGIHASALFNLKGELIEIKEDVGRHNALDKLIGSAVQKNEIPLFNHILFLSGRVSFELVQKASMVGFRMICAVGAPSSLAVELAEELDITLVGFLRENRFNIYSAPERIVL